MKLIGTHTIEIYALQYYCWVTRFDNKVVDAAISFVLALTVPLLIAKIIENSKILGFLLVGRIPKRIRE